MWLISKINVNISTLFISCYCLLLGGSNFLLIANLKEQDVVFFDVKLVLKIVVSTILLILFCSIWLSYFKLKKIIDIEIENIEKEHKL